MKERAEQVLADVFTRHSDRRLDLFKVRVESARAQSVKLTGRVLTPDSLQAVTDAMPGVKVDLAGVKVLRAKPGVTYTVATTLTDLHVEPSFTSELLTQVVRGTPLEVLEDHDDGKWVFVRQADGYLGWAYKPYLKEGAPAGGATHIVAANVAHVVREPGSGTMTRLSCGTSVKAEETRGEWVKIDGGWVQWRDLRPIGAVPPDAGRRIVEDARTFVGVYYLWGGGSAWGIDCSGLAQLTHRLSGVTLPRDADMQFKAATPVTGPHREGDLFFFHSDTNKEKITHVGICTGGWGVIHSSRFNNGVYEEDVQARDALKNTLAGVRSFLRR